MKTSDEIRQLEVINKIMKYLTSVIILVILSSFFIPKCKSIPLVECLSQHGASHDKQFDSDELKSLMHLVGCLRAKRPGGEAVGHKLRFNLGQSYFAKMPTKVRTMEYVERSMKGL